MGARKYIRIGLSADDDAAFAKAKAQAEAQAGITLSDSLYALSVIRQAIKAKA